MIDREILERLSIITEEERAIINGSDAPVQKPACIKK